MSEFEDHKMCRHLNVSGRMLELQDVKVGMFGVFLTVASDNDLRYNYRLG